MKLHSRAFEKTLRRSVKQAVRASRELTRQFRASKIRRQYRAARALRIGMSIALALIVSAVMDTPRALVSALAVVTLWAFAFAFVHAHGLMTRLYASTDLQALLILP